MSVILSVTVEDLALWYLGCDEDLAADVERLDDLFGPHVVQNEEALLVPSAKVPESKR